MRRSILAQISAIRKVTRMSHDCRNDIRGGEAIKKRYRHLISVYEFIYLRNYCGGLLHINLFIFHLHIHIDDRKMIAKVYCSVGLRNRNRSVIFGSCTI